MKTIIIGHDPDSEIKFHGRFNEILPLLRTYGATDNVDIIHPDRLDEYLDTNNKIVYALTARIPQWGENQEKNDDRWWLHDISEEIPANIVALANEGKLHIAFFVGEIITLLANEILSEVNEQCSKAGLNRNSITVYVPNFHVHVLGVRHLKFISIFEMSYWNYLLRSELPLNENIIQSVNLKSRSKKFTCLNHLNKSHRLCIGATLFNTGKHVDGYFSYHDNHQHIDGQPYGVLKETDTDLFRMNLPFLIDTDDPEVVNYHWDVKKEFFNDAYWNFVTESFFEEFYGLTEKTFKPIVNLQPFIIFGPSGSLVALHKLGYKTFRTVIDETYDLIKDPDRRMKTLFHLAAQLIEMTDEQHIAMMTELKPILEHNQRVFFNKKWEQML